MFFVFTNKEINWMHIFWFCRFLPWFLHNMYLELSLETFFLRLTFFVSPKVILTKNRVCQNPHNLCTDFYP